jgi:heme a synthase
MQNIELRSFRKFAIITIIAVLLLVAVGGIVRSTGSGMGCPDWPKCFNQWVPPTDISQLPADYKTRFKVMNREIADFNVFHTWTEYINRLLGVLIGLFIIGTCWFAWKTKKIDRKIWVLSLAALVFVLLEGWLGSIVVKTDLHRGIVTVHMVGAILIIFILIYAVLIADRHLLGVEHTQVLFTKKPIVAKAGILATIIIFVQVILGTQVRERVDEVQKLYNDTARNQWVAELGIAYDWHKLFYILPIVFLFYWVKLILENGFTQIRWISNSIKAIGVILLLEIIIGWVMAYNSIPPIFQPIHLTLGILLLCICFAMAGFATLEWKKSP